MLVQEDIKELMPGLKRYWLKDHKIVVFEATAASRVLVDAWMHSVIDVMEQWPLDRPYLVIHDFRGNNVVLSPYARKRSQELLPISPHVPGYAAIVVSTSLFGYAVHWFLRASKAGKIENRLFFDYDKALDWLQSKVVQPQPRLRPVTKS